MLRITSGTAKNKRLVIPDVEGFRAVQEKAKLALFSIIGDKISGAYCLDLFAGSGNLGLESISRGAAWCDFVDESPLSTVAIESNLHNCGFLENGEMFRKNVIKYIETCSRLYDVIYIDPFYKQTNNKYLFKIMDKVLKEDGVAVYFHTKGFNPKELVEGTGLSIADTRKFGESVFDILKRPH